MEVKEITDKGIYEKIWQEQNLHILQSWAWGEVKSTAYQPVRLLFSENAQTVFVLSLLSKKLSTFKITFAYIPKLALPRGKEAEIIKLLKDYCKEKLDLDFLLLEFAKTKTQLVPELKQLPDHALQIQPQQTIQVILPNGNLWDGMKGNYRQNVRKAQKHGVIVLPYSNSKDVVGINIETRGEITNRDISPLEAFYSVMLEIFRNTKFLPRSKEYFTRIWEILSAEGKAKIFLARFQKKVVGWYLVVYDHLGVYELYGGVTPQGRNLEAGYLLKYIAMLDAQKMQRKFYDHWGVAPKLQNNNFERTHDLYNISLFKEGFGGEYLEFALPKVVVINALSYQIFTFLQRLNKLKTFFKKIA